MIRTPSEHQAAQLKTNRDAQEAEENRQREEAQLRAAVDAVLRLESGRVFWAYLFKLCRYNQSSIAIDPATKDIQTIATQHNEAMRLVYLMIRAKASPELLKEAEHLAEFGASNKKGKGEK